METLTNVRVVIVGGGFGGLEAALYLRQRLGEATHVTLVSDRDHFTFRPYLTYIPFGLAPENVTFDLAALARAQGIVFLQGRVRDLAPDRHVIHVDEQPLAYDFLIIATGATVGPEAIPGLHEHAYAIWRQADMERLQAAYEQLLAAAQAGQRRRIVCLVPPSCQWAGPLYEMTFMLATWLQGKRAQDRVDLVFLTWESSYMQALGGGMHVVIQEELERKHIEGHTGHVACRVEADSVIDQEDQRRPYDLLITAPSYVASTTWKPLPVDKRGFLRTEPSTRQVVNHPDVYAVGDASDYPVKQAFLALLQADAAAEHLAARVLETEPTFGFDPRSVWMIDQLDQTILAQVSLEQETPTQGGAENLSEVERMPAGILHRMMVMTNLPSQFGENPLYSGLLWKGTKVGLKILSQLTQPKDAGIE